MRLEAELEEMRGKKTNLKKRLKKEKDVVEQLSRELAEREKGFDETKKEFLMQLQAAQHQLEGRQEELESRKQQANLYEVHQRELDVKLSNSENALRKMKGRVIELEGERDSLGATMAQHEGTVKQMKEEIDALLDFKNELEILIDSQNEQIMKRNQKNKHLEELLVTREEELEKKDRLLKRITSSADETKKKLMTAEQKLKHLSANVLKDLRNTLREKENELQVLKDMLKSSTR